MGDFQSGISKDLMGYQSMLSQQEQSNARFEEFNYGMDSMREQERLQSKFANDQFGRDIGMLGATGEQTRKNYAAMGVQNRLGQITAGEQTRLNYAAQVIRPVRTIVSTEMKLGRLIPTVSAPLETRPVRP